MGKQPNLLEQFRKNAADLKHNIQVGVGAEPDYKLYDPKTKTLYAVDKGLTGGYSVKAIHNPTAEQSRYSENINTFRNNLGEKLYDMALDYNAKLSSVDSYGLRQIPHGREAPTTNTGVRALYDNVNNGYGQAGNTDQGTLTDRLYNQDHEPGAAYEKLQTNEKELNDVLKPQVDVLAAIDKSMAAAPKPSGPAVAPGGQ